MPILVGADEAGYGPNLGPLIVTATVWRVSGRCDPADLYERLAEAVSSSPRVSHDDRRIPIGDSKRLYGSSGRRSSPSVATGRKGEVLSPTEYPPSGSLARLERGVLVAAGALERRISSWREAWALLAGNPREIHDEPWHQAYDEPLPIDDDSARLPSRIEFFQTTTRNAGVQLADLRSRAVFPAEFNRLVKRFDSKGEALSRVTLELLRDAIAPMVDDEARRGTNAGQSEDAPDGERAADDDLIVMTCDKHGGRNRYASLVQSVFDDAWIEVLHESRERSVYRWRCGKRTIEARFVAKGDSLLPAALASMTSKYLRELAMRAFNAFWRNHVADLKPTAGYPVDAKRFKSQIARTQERLNITDDLLWRIR